MNSNHQSPNITTRDASRVAFELYSLQVTARHLPGELDYNFHLRNEAGQEFVLKIAHQEQQKDILDLQNRVLERLAAQDPSLILPRVYQTSSGEATATITLADHTTRFVRLLNYVPGKLFARYRPHSPALLHSLGVLLGRMDDAL